MQEERSIGSLVIWLVLAVMGVATLALYSRDYLSFTGGIEYERGAQIDSEISLDQITSCLLNEEVQLAGDEELAYVSMANSVAATPDMNHSALVSNDRQLRVDVSRENGGTLVEVRYNPPKTKLLQFIELCANGELL